MIFIYSLRNFPIYPHTKHTYEKSHYAPTQKATYDQFKLQFQMQKIKKKKNKVRKVNYYS